MRFFSQVASLGVSVSGVDGLGGGSGMAVVAVTPVFKTPPPDGPYRHEVVVEVLSLNGPHYVGTVTPTEIMCEDQ